MKFKYLLIIFLSIFTFRYSYSQEYLPQMESRYFTSDSISVLKAKPFWAAGEVIGTNLAVWAFDRYVVKESWARINCKRKLGSHQLEHHQKQFQAWTGMGQR